MSLQTNKIKLAKLLMEKSYREGDFTLASGRKSDYYFDCRVTALSAEGSYLIGKIFCELLHGYPEVKGVGGMTMGADPLVSAITTTSWRMWKKVQSLPTYDGLLVRKAAKDHGTNRMVEGMANFAIGDRVAAVEDVITTGGSVLKAVHALENEGLLVPAVMVILDREEGGADIIRQEGYDLVSIFTRKELKAYAAQ